MKNLIPTLLCLLCSSAAMSQSLTTDQVLNKIVLINQQVNGKISWGSAFIIRDDSDTRFFLVTAHHVADLLHPEAAKITFQVESNKAKSFALKPFLSDTGVLRFDQTSDFFLKELVPYNTETKALLVNKSFPTKALASDRVSISRDYPLKAFGYPFYDIENFAAISFSTQFASGLMTVNNSDKTKCFCYVLENPGMQGFSGGPVLINVTPYTIPDQNTLIVGIISATTADATGGKFAVVSPMYKLLDLVNNK